MKRVITYSKLIGFGLFAYIISRLNLQQIAYVFEGVRLIFLVPYVMFFFTHFCLKCYRWHIIQHHFSDGCSFNSNIALNIEALYLSFATPGRFGDVIKVLLMEQYFKIPRRRGLIIYFFDRFQDIAFLLVIGLVGMILIIEYHFSWIVYSLLGCMMSLILFKNLFLNYLVRKYNISERIRVSMFFELKVVLITIGAFVLLFSQIYMLSLTLNMKVSYVYLAVVHAIGAILSMLPISFGGIGVRESVFVFFLEKSGADPEQAVALSLLDNVVFPAAFIFCLHILNIVLFKRGMRAYDGN